MLVHLIRHAHAGSRTAWNLPDAQRPLSDKGLSQAAALSELDVGQANVHSSPAIRCTQTVDPLASRLGVAVQVDNRLAEGSDPSNVVGWICQAPDDGLVLCSHGDILPEVLRLLALRGMTLDGPPAVQKASVWVCDIRDGQPHHASYIPPPRLS